MMNIELLKKSAWFGLKMAVVTLAIYILLGYIARLFLDSWKPIAGSMYGYYGMLLGMLLVTFFAQTWIKYRFLKKKKAMEESHKEFLDSLEGAYLENN